MFSEREQREYTNAVGYFITQHLDGAGSKTRQKYGIRTFLTAEVAS
jgi:hypothetical protein